LGGLVSFVRKRIQPYIVEIQAHELTHEDRNNLDKALKEDYDGSTVKDVLEKSILGFCQIWRLGKSEGIIVSEVVQRDEGWHLWLTHLAGKGMIRKLDDIENHFVSYGKRYNCLKIRWAGLEGNKKIQRVYAKRWKPVAQIFERKI
jgi:hypothetical protein